MSHRGPEHVSHEDHEDFSVFFVTFVFFVTNTSMSHFGRLSCPAAEVTASTHASAVHRDAPLETAFFIERETVNRAACYRGLPTGTSMRPNDRDATTRPIEPSARALAVCGVDTPSESP